MTTTSHVPRPLINRRQLTIFTSLAFAWSGAVVMWLFWICFVIFLWQPVAIMPWWPLPTVDWGGWLETRSARVVMDVALIALFGLQHSVMARPRFKAWLAQWVRQPYERCLFVHMANIALFAMIVLWQPLPTEIWSLPKGWATHAVWVVFALGWLMLLAGAWSFGLGELLGVRQMHQWLKGERLAAPPLKTGLLYRWLPHPMYLGVLVGVWLTPSMTLGHLLLAAGLTVYVAIGLHLEERDLVRRFGTSYQRWRSLMAERQRSVLSRGLPDLASRESSPSGRAVARVPPSSKS